MRVTRRQLRTLIESVLREEKTMSKGDAKKLQTALTIACAKGFTDIVLLFRDICAKYKNKQEFS